MPSWRDLVEVHPDAEIFPLLSPEELNALRLDIEANGLKHPVVLFKGKLIDGRNRMDAMSLEQCKQALVDAVHLSDIINTKNYVISANIRRRHLDHATKILLTEVLLREDTAKSNRAVARLVGLSDNTVRKVRGKLESRAQIAHVSQASDSIGRQQPTRKSGRVPSPTPKTWDVDGWYVESLNAKIAADKVLKELETVDVTTLTDVTIDYLATIFLEAAQPWIQLSERIRKDRNFRGHLSVVGDK